MTDPLTNQGEFPSGGGETGQRMRAHDWAGTPLGAAGGWPQALRAAVNLMLNSPESMYLVWGPELMFLFNDAYRPILGPRLDGALGRPLRAIWPDAWDAVRAPLEKALAGEASRFEDVPITLARRGAEEETWWSYSYSPIFDDAGRVAGVFCLTNETTARVLGERHRAETLEALRQSEARQARALRIAQLGSFEWSLATGTMTLDQRSREIFGLEREAGGTEEAVFRRMHPDDLPRVLALAMEHAFNGQRLAVEYRILLPGGEERTVSSLGDVLMRRDGRPGQMVGVVADVTERVLAQAKLREGEAQLRALNASLEGQVAARTAELRLYRDIIWSNTDPICAFDTEFRLTAFNQAHSDEFDRIFGHRVRLGEVFPDLLPPDQAPIMRALMARALAGEAYVTSEEFGNSELGKPMWEIAYTPLRDEGGQVVGAFHYARNITARLRAEAELAATQEALRQSQKMEAVGQLTGGLAHDFNNLLTGITGSLELISNRIAQGRGQELGRYVNAAQDAARRAASLTHRLLAFSRRQTLAPKPTDVNQLVAGMEDLIRRTIGSRIRLEVVASEGLWPALIDGGQLENALLNLCINARDAIPESGLITVETSNRSFGARSARERDLPPGAYLSLCVSDTGTGMTPEVIAKAFDPFFTTKPIGTGTGLGLSMIYGFARQSGGTACIFSEVGEGTSVCLYLPRYLGPAAAADPVRTPAAAPARPRRILVIDDEPTLRLLVSEVVEDMGHLAASAATGAAGLAVLQGDEPVDLLITDVGLPDMNGQEVARAARRIRPNLTVLFITGYVENLVHGHFILDPGMHVLTKPFAMDALARRIDELVQAAPG
jgi:PAS domain S-box-containing protein